MFVDPLQLSRAIQILHATVDPLCPNNGSTIDNPLDVKTWRIWPTAEATPEQIDAAELAIAGIDASEVLSAAP